MNVVCYNMVIVSKLDRCHYDIFIPHLGCRVITTFLLHKTNPLYEVQLEDGSIR